MSSINEWKRRNKSLDAINKQLSEKILVLEAEIEQLKKRAALFLSCLISASKTKILPDNSLLMASRLLFLRFHSFIDDIS